MPPTQVITPSVQPIAPTPTTVAEANAFTRLHQAERDYLSGMKRKDRMDIVRMIGNSKVARREVPLRIQVLQSFLPHHIRLQIFDDLGRNNCEKYLTWVRRIIRVPINVMHPQRTLGNIENLIQKARDTMDNCITGHADAKREVLKLICQANSTGGFCASNYSLGFEGPPGTGKTHFVKTALASALDRPLISIPLGGANDVAYLLGHLYVYEGSKEGRLAGALMEAKCCNPIIYFDEVDKISSTERGSELIGALIHLVDPTANTALRDRYFHNLDIDYSKCTFVFSYNDASRVSPILLDRIKRIPMPTPTDDERKAIICNHLVPRVHKRLNTKIVLSEEALGVIVQRASMANGGMRLAEKDVDHVIANAHLCHACKEDNGELAGAKDVKVFDKEGNVSGAFASRVLPLEAVLEGAPPAGMYN